MRLQVIEMRKSRNNHVRICNMVKTIRMIITVSLLVARPAVKDENGGREYIAVIDASASMLTENSEGVSRFERAVAYIDSLALEVDSGSRMTIISAADDAAYLLQRSQSQTEIKLVLRGASCSYGGADITGALELAQLICDRYSDSEVVLLTDRDYENSENVLVVNLSQDEWNVTVSSLTYTRRDGVYTFTGIITSSGRDASVSAALKIDGKIIDAKFVDCRDGEAAEVTFTAEAVTDFDTAVLYTEPDDGLEADNSYAVCKKATRESAVLIVSDAPFYLESVFGVMSGCDITVVSSSEAVEMTGYELYVFDGYVPESLPEDGSVWIINPDRAVEGISEPYVVEGDATLSAVAENEAPFLVEDMSPEAIQLSSYLKTELSGAWSTALYCGSDPVLFTKKSENGMRTTVLMFDIHDSNLPLLSDYVALVRNIIESSVPSLLDKTDYSIGDIVNISVLPNSLNLYVQLPDGAAERLNVSGDYTAFSPQNVGVYTAVATLSNGGGQYCDFFVHIPSGESVYSAGDSVSVTLSEASASADEAGEGENALHELWFWLAAVMLALLLAEWGLYYYEQY